MGVALATTAVQKRSVCKSGRCKAELMVVMARVARAVAVMAVIVAVKAADLAAAGVGSDFERHGRGARDIQQCRERRRSRQVAMACS